MSILRKIPKIEQVLDNMSLESLKRLESLMNSGNGATETYTLFGGENKLNYENKDLGVWYCNIELERNKSVETGFLIWESETKALFISFDITQCLKEYEIDLTNYTFVLINEKLSIEEFRRVLEDNINKEVVHIDTSGNVEVGKNLVVDGKVILNGKADLVDTSGNELISGGEGLNILSLNLKNCMNESNYNELVGYILQKIVIAKTYNITLPDLTDVDIVKFTVETPAGNISSTFYRNSKAMTEFNWLCNWADDENFIQMVTIIGFTDDNVEYIKYNGINSGGSGGEILELNATDAATLMNILDGNIPSGVQEFSTNYDLKDYNKVKISMEGMEGYYDVSNKLYMPNTLLQFDIFNNYSTSVGSSLDYVRVRVSFYPGSTTYECHKFKLSLITA